MRWPMVNATITRRFFATHCLQIAGGVVYPHGHDYVARFGFAHEMNPNFGTVGSKALCDWDASVRECIELVDGQDLNTLLAPRLPTIEMLCLFMLSKLPGFFDWLELESYDPPFTARIDRKGARFEWLS